VASHGHSHRRFPSLSFAELRDELHRSSQLLPPVLAPLHVRPPHGAVSPSSLASSVLLGFSTVLWSLDSLDYKLREGQQVADHVLSQPVSGGEIVLLHEGQDWTLDALPPIVESLRRRGFELVTVGEMLTGRSR
jgi:peptidoglycan/xylan/chitin deacetylase (PgdA/CDA1 family)